MTLTYPTADAVQAIERQLEERIGAHRFQLWFKKSSRLQFAGDQLVIEVPNNYVGGWIKNHFSDQIRDSIKDALQQEASILYHINVELAKTQTAEPKEVMARPAKEPGNGKLRRKLRNTLDTFVVGSGNELAYSTIRTIVDKIISPYNPLFIHGGCGLGKTHLLQGLCNAISERHPNVGWHYLSGEEFTNQFIVAVKNGSLDAFRRQYRNVDVLVIDDVHFLANKRATQEEFLHTYNAINAAGKQVVMASDAHPKSIAQLHNSLVDRFISGMVVQISPPDRETRAKIIEARADQLGHSLPEGVVQLISDRVTGNVRELEGAILKMLAYSSLCNKPISIDVAEKVVREYGHPNQANTQISRIEQVVAERFNISVTDIRSSKRTRSVAMARAIAMYLARKHTAMSFPEIGKYLGNKNHSTVVLACQKVEQQLATQDDITWDANGKAQSGKLAAVIADLEQHLKI